MNNAVIETDVLVIGGGIASCRAAIEAFDHGAQVALVTKGLFGRDAAATWMAIQGYQCWGIYPHDTLDVQVEDTLRCGWFLNNQENVYAFLAHAPDTAMELLNWGVRFMMDEGKFAPTWQLGCSTEEGRSIYPATHHRGRLGLQYIKVLPPIVRSRNVRIIEDVFVVDLLKYDDQVVGALGIDIRTGAFIILKAKATILATGGYQGLYPFTHANPNLTGDGQAMALRAGVDTMDFEFNQTLPCAIWPPELSGSLLPFELMMEWDARLYNSDKVRFLAKWDTERMEHSTRAVLSRGIFHEIKEGKASPHGGVYLSVSHKPKDFIKEKIKEYSERPAFIKLNQAGIDLSKDYIETGYALLYCQGGCSINPKCETDIPGLYAIGEVASGSKDGADRMMSNSLPACMGMGIIAGRASVEKIKAMKMPGLDKSQIDRIEARIVSMLERQLGIAVNEARANLQGLMMKETGYGRNEEGLNFALKEIELYKETVLPNLYVANKSRRFNMEWIGALEFENLLLVAECIVRNSLSRNESRGLHDRWDYMAPDPDWFKNLHIRLVDGDLQQWETPVEFTYWKPELDSLGEPWHRGTQVKEYSGWRAKPLYERT